MSKSHSNFIVKWNVLLLVWIIENKITVDNRNESIIFEKTKQLMLSVEFWFYFCIFLFLF